LPVAAVRASNALHYG